MYIFRDTLFGQMRGFLIDLTQRSPCQISQIPLHTPNPSHLEKMHCHHTYTLLLWVVAEIFSVGCIEGKGRSGVVSLCT